MNEINFVEKLIGSREYTELKKLKMKFDLLSLFNDAIVENSWSRILAFLFDSKREHGLRQTAFRAWLGRVVDESREKQVDKFLRSLPPENESETLARAEWVTESQRRIDIVVEVKEVRGGKNKTKAVLGIENKLWSGEQNEQIGDYQKSLSKEFDLDAEKMILFLTPEGRSALTSDTIETCPCAVCSYDSIKKMCEEIGGTANSMNPQVGLLIDALNEHIGREIMGNDEFTKKAKELVQTLYLEPGHRQAMKLIADNIPTIRAVVDRIPVIAGEILRERNVKNPRHIALEWVYGNHEVNLNVGDINGMFEKKHPGMAIYFMLLSAMRPTAADIGHGFTLRVMLYLDSKNRNQRESLAGDIRERLGSLGVPAAKSPQKQWGPWSHLWVGESYVLQDLGKEDIHGLARILVDGIEKTYNKLVQCVQEMK